MLANSLRPPSVPSQALAGHVTRGSIQRVQEGLPTARLGSEAPIVVVLASGSSDLSAWGANGERARLSEILRRPLEDFERDEEYQEKVKVLLRKAEIGNSG